jgi:hypothetical protein
MFILQILAHNAKSYISYMAKYTSDFVNSCLTFQACY